MEIVGSTEKKDTNCTRRPDYYVGGGGFLRGVSDRRMPRPDQATREPKKLPARKEEKASLKKLPDRSHASGKTPAGNRAT